MPTQKFLPGLRVTLSLKSAGLMDKVLLRPVQHSLVSISQSRSFEGCGDGVITYADHKSGQPCGPENAEKPSLQS